MPRKTQSQKKKDRKRRKKVEALLDSLPEVKGSALASSLPVSSTPAYAGPAPKFWKQYEEWVKAGKPSEKTKKEQEKNE